MEPLINGVEHTDKIGKLVSVDVHESGSSVTVNGILTATWDTYPAAEDADVDNPIKTILYIGGTELWLDWSAGKIVSVQIVVLGD